MADDDEIAVEDLNAGELISDECGVDVQTDRFIIVGCEDVPGFEAVAKGEKVDVEHVTPGMVAKARRVVLEHPDVRAILMTHTIEGAAVGWRQRFCH